MNKQMIWAAGAAVFAIAVLSAILPARADEVTSTVTAYDRVAGVLVLKDKSVIALDKMTGDAPATLSAGDRVSIEYEGDEDGISAINSITILSEGDQS
jgi:hypothetical protein